MLRLIALAFVLLTASTASAQYNPWAYTHAVQRSMEQSYYYRTPPAYGYYGGYGAYRGYGLYDDDVAWELRQIRQQMEFDAIARPRWRRR